MKQIIEIKGVKMEVDLREATTVDTFKVGDHVKLLLKKYSDYVPYAGVIIGFDNFKKLPTIVVAYLEANYGSAEIKLAYVNQTSDAEMVPANDGDVPFSKAQIMELLEKDINLKQQALDGANWHKDRFVEWFGKHFVPSEVEEKAEIS